MFITILGVWLNQRRKNCKKDKIKKYIQKINFVFQIDKCGNIQITNSTIILSINRLIIKKKTLLKKNVGKI